MRFGVVVFCCCHNFAAVASIGGGGHYLRAALRLLLAFGDFGVVLSSVSSSLSSDFAFSRKWRQTCRLGAYHIAEHREYIVDRHGTT